MILNYSCLSYAASTVYIDANLYNLTANDKILDFSRIVACSLLVTPATIYNVTFTYALPTDNGIEMQSLNITTHQTHIDLRKVLDVNFSYEGVSVTADIK